MQRGIVGVSALFLGALLFLDAAHAETELKNDGFISGQAAGFQGGFNDGEIGAVRLVALAPSQLLAVRLLYGGAAATRTVTLHIWDDSAGGTNPGAEIFNGDFELMGSNDSMQELSLAGENVFVPMQFRIGIELQGTPGQATGLPGIARDGDNSIAADKNFIYNDGGISFSWFRSFDLGLRGDWIIRAVVADGGGSPDAGVTPDASTGSPDANAGGPDAGSGNVCTGNGDCEIGEYCDLEVHTCTFDCRHDSDCPGSGECNSLGQCIGADGGAGGCCETGTSSSGGEGALGAIGLAGLVGFVVARRRRSSRRAGTGRGSRPA